MTRWTTALLGAWLLGACAGSAGAAETVLEDFAGTMTFAPRWPGVSIETGRDAERAWLRATTAGRPGESGNGFIANATAYQPRLDLDRRFVKLWLEVEDVSRLSGIELRLSSDRFTDSYFAFSLPLYTDPDANVLQSGVWTPITFPFASARVVGTPDRSAIDSIGWYLADRGEGPVTVSVGGISAVPEPPAGVVSFTFDDGYDEHHLAARWMKRHGFRGTAFVIPGAVGTYGYMTLAQLRELQQRYRWEVAAHHETPFTSFAPDELERTLGEVQAYLRRHGFGAGAAHLAYPLGKWNVQAVQPLVRRHFTTARVAGGQLETLPPGDPYLLRVFNVTAETTPEQIGAAARRAADDRHWLILMFHYLVEAPSRPTEYGLDDFRRALAAVERAGVAVRPLGEVFEACSDPSGQCQPAAAPAARP